MNIREEIYEYYLELSPTRHLRGQPDEVLLMALEEAIRFCPEQYIDDHIDLINRFKAQIRQEKIEKLLKKD